MEVVCFTHMWAELHNLSGSLQTALAGAPDEEGGGAVRMGCVSQGAL